MKPAAVSQLGRSVASQMAARAGDEAGSATIGAGKPAPIVFIGIVRCGRDCRAGHLALRRHGVRHRRNKVRIAPHDPRQPPANFWGGKRQSRRDCIGGALTGRSVAKAGAVAVTAATDATAQNSACALLLTPPTPTLGSPAGNYGGRRAYQHLQPTSSCRSTSFCSIWRNYSWSFSPWRARYF